jgi:hypothetical protein
MTRRLGLAAALCLTTIVGFAVIVLGRQAGFFGGGASTEAQPLAVLPSATAPVPASPTPVVIEQYVYRDQYYSSSAGSAAPAGGSNSQPAPANNTAAPPPASSPNSPGDDEDDASPPASQPPAPAAPPAASATEFSGQVIALSSGSMTVATEGGQTTVYLAPDTSVHGGALAVGAGVRVHAIGRSDGTLLATEIEVAVSGGETEPHDEDD